MQDDGSESGDPLIGRVIDGRFTIQSVLGRGGMGVVYKAHQASLDRSLALKVMTGVPPEREAEFQRRFFLEAATAARLKHPNTITIFDYGSSVVDDERVFFIAMELLDGIPLQKLVAKGRALAPMRAVHIALQIARSLREAHKVGVVHRDLKPGNVMLVKQDDADDVDGDFVKVLDFGLAKVPQQSGDPGVIEGLTKAGTFMGSPRYVAPEQVEGRPVDARADVYSLGCILFRMLTGRVPFDGKTPVEIMLKHLHEPVPKLGVAMLPVSLEKLVQSMLAKHASDRPQTMDVVMQRLKAVRSELGGTGSGLIATDVLSQVPAHVIDVSLSDPAVQREDVVSTRVDRRGSQSSQAFASQSQSQSQSQSSSHGSSSRSRPRLEPLHEVDEQFVEPPITQHTHTPTGTPTASTVETPAPLGMRDDSTRPTRVLGRLTAVPPPKKQWVAIARGVVVGLLICGGIAAWRLGAIERVKHELVARGLVSVHANDDSNAQSGTAIAEVQGPLAAHAMIRIVTDPAGADVLEVQSGLPRLLGVTPLTLKWDVDPRPRELLLRKDGYKPSTALIPPPAKGDADPVWLDVAATLHAK